MIQIDELRRAAENLVRRDALAQYEAWMGGSTVQPPPTGPLEELDPFTPEGLACAAEATTTATSEGEARVAGLLYRGLLSGLLDRLVRDALNDATSSAVAHASFLAGEPVGPGWGQATLLATEDPEQRLEFHARLLTSWAGSAPYYLRLTTRLHEAAAGLGLPDPDGLLGVLARVDPEQLRRSAQQLLRDTDDLLRELQEEAVHVFRLPAHPAHLELLFGLPGLEHRFTTERLLPVAGEILERLGLAVAQEQGLQVVADPVSRPRPSRAFPLNLPREVRLVVNRAPGLQAAQLHLLALGTALHWLHTEPGPFPLRWPFGHRAVSDAFGLTLASLLTLPAVLRDRGVPLQVADAVCRAARRHELLHVRTVAALVASHPCGPENAAEPYEAYAAALGRARRVPVGEEEARAWPCRMEATYAAETFQSWLLAAALRAELLDRGGKDFWRDPDSGLRWLELLRTGQRLSATELMATLSLGGRAPVQPLDPAPLVSWLGEGAHP
jgi:hypothetical protein